MSDNDAPRKMTVMELQRQIAECIRLGEASLEADVEVDLFRQGDGGETYERVIVYANRGPFALIVDSRSVKPDPFDKLVVEIYRQLLDK